MDDLRKLAEAEYGVRNEAGFIFETRWPTRYPEQYERYERETAQRQADAKLAAACSPERILALLDVVDKARAVVDSALASWSAHPRGDLLADLNTALQALESAGTGEGQHADPA